MLLHMTTKPTRFQYFLAESWLVLIWQWGWPVLITVWTFASVGLPLSALSDMRSIAGVLILGAIAFALGFFLAVPTGWVILGVYFYSRGIKNGAPYEPGDLVRVLAGPFRDTIAPVYAKWKDFAVRVDLGPSAKQTGADCFCWYQIMRADTDEQNDA
jgi:hypothetical protein